MDFSIIQHAVYSFLSGLTELLPVSARAHSTLMLKVLGAEAVSGLPVLMIHIGMLIALYTYSRVQLVKMSRARKLSRIPKKKRKRPLDVASLMDSRFLIIMSIPTVLSVLLFGRMSQFNFSLLLISVLLFVNGIILYIPQFLPSSNRNALSLSPFDGLLMGFGHALSVIPGISGMAAATSVASVCGVDRTYALNMSVMVKIMYTIGLIVHDILFLTSHGLGTISISLLLVCLLAAFIAFVSTTLGIRVMRILSAGSGYHFFAYYCWGLAVLAFILNLMA